MTIQINPETALTNILPALPPETIMLEGIRVAIRVDRRHESKFYPLQELLHILARVTVECQQKRVNAIQYRSGRDPFSGMTTANNEELELIRVGSIV